MDITEPSALEAIASTDQTVRNPLSNFQEIKFVKMSPMEEFFEDQVAKLIALPIERPVFVNLAYNSKFTSAGIDCQPLSEALMNSTFKIYQFDIPSEVSKAMTSIKVFVDPEVLPWAGGMKCYPNSRAICVYSTYTSLSKDKKPLRSLVFIGPDAKATEVYEVSRKKFKDKLFSARKVDEDEKDMWI